MRPDLVQSVVAIDFTPYIENEVLDALKSRVNAGDRHSVAAGDRGVSAKPLSRYALMPPEAVKRRAMAAIRSSRRPFSPACFCSEAMALTATGLARRSRTGFQNRKTAGADRPRRS